MIELIEHLEDVRLAEDLTEVGLIGDRTIDLLLVGLFGLGDDLGRTHAELEAHDPFDSADAAGFPS